MHWRRDRLPTLVFLGFPGGSDGKESARNAGDLGSIPGSGARNKGLQVDDIERLLTISGQAQAVSEGAQDALLLQELKGDAKDTP